MTCEKKDIALDGVQLADLVVEHLEAMGVEYVFGVPGGAIEPLYDALARAERRGTMRAIVARHEAGAAFMADGYARETGKIGVCCSTTGPGATNLLTGVASAMADNIPLLVLTAQTALPLFGQRALQESSCTAVNTVAMFQNCTRYSSLVSHRAQLEHKLLSAITATQGPPPGPAHLSLPMDVLASKRRMRDDDLSLCSSRLLRQNCFADEGSIEELACYIERSRKTVMVIGNGCGEGIEEITRFAELFNVQLVSGPSGKRWVNSYHPLYHGVLGFAGHDSARNCLLNDDVELILAVGTRFGELIFGGWKLDEKLNNKLVHIDETSENFTRTPNARLHVTGTLSTIFSKLMQRLSTDVNADVIPLPTHQAVPGFMDQTVHACYDDQQQPIKPAHLMTTLSKVFPRDTRYIIDAGNSWAWATHYLHPNSRGLYRVAMGFGAMAWAVGTAVGTAFGCPGHPVVCLTGDGSFLMSGQEITVAVQEKLPVIFVVLNDQALGMVKHGQRLGGGEPIAFDLPPVDFALMAKAMGAASETIHTIEELKALDIEEISQRSGPTLLDVYIDPEEVPPMGTRMKTLGR